MVLNAELNDIALKILWAEAVHMCERVINIMDTMDSTTSLFGIFY